MTVFDIIKGFCTAFYEKGQLIEDKKKIIKTYAKNGLPYDILSLIGIIANRLFFPNLSYVVGYVINLLVFFKITNIISILTRIDTTF